MNCQSCGMPMATIDDHGGGRVDNLYCRHCTDQAGNLKPKEEVREGMINFYMQSMGKTREEAETAVDSHMAQMSAWAADRPAWSGSAGQPTPPQPTAEEPPVSAPPPPAPETPPASIEETPSQTEPAEEASKSEPVSPAASEVTPEPEPVSQTEPPAAPGAPTAGVGGPSGGQQEE